MKPVFRTLTLSLLLFNCACATVVEGTSQKITVSSQPQGAQCFIKQADTIVGRLTTPGTSEVPKTKNDLVIFCSKEGYESVSVTNRSDLAITSLGNAAFYELSFLGNAVDSATGAANKYDSKVFVRLNPSPAPTVFPAPPGMPVAYQLPQQSVARLTMQAEMPAALMAAMPAPSTPVAMPVAAPSVTPAAAPAVSPAPSPATPPASHTPPLRAARMLADAAIKAADHFQPHLTYAQATAESLRRPPFEIEQ